jgi:rhodanese-related sulfurtransferase
MAEATRQEMVDKVTAEEVMRWMDRGKTMVFVDVRNSKDWAESNEKLPGAIRIPAGEVERHLDEIPKNVAGEAWIVTYCT